MAEQFGLAMPVRFDPDGALANVLDMPVNSGELVLTQGNIIETKTWGAHASLGDTLEDIFGF